LQRRARGTGALQGVPPDDDEHEQELSFGGKSLKRMKEPTERFSDRVENYAKYRPHYPDDLLAFIRETVPRPARIADVGSGTGILTRQLLGAGYEVYGVEPNAPMRAEAERTLEADPRFHSIEGAAESTSLADQSIDFITSAQAFHWFDRAKTKVEFRRILKHRRLVALIWNDRQADASTFSWKYEELLRRALPEYLEVSHRHPHMEDIRVFFEPGEVVLKKFPNVQQLGREAFIGRLLSSSYVPLEGQPGHQEVMKAAERLFDENAVNGAVSFAYETILFLGAFDAFPERVVEILERQGIGDSV
jgi:SAM-dependent methyltransferase